MWAITFLRVKVSQGWRSFADTSCWNHRQFLLQWPWTTAHMGNREYRFKIPGYSPLPVKAKYLLLPPVCPSRSILWITIRRLFAHLLDMTHHTLWLCSDYQEKQLAFQKKKKKVKWTYWGYLLQFVFDSQLHPFVLCCRTYNLMAPFFPKVFMPLTSHLSFTAPHYSTLPTHSIPGPYHPAPTALPSFRLPQKRAVALAEAERRHAEPELCSRCWFGDCFHFHPSCLT